MYTVHAYSQVLPTWDKGRLYSCNQHPLPVHIMPPPLQAEPAYSHAEYRHTLISQLAFPGYYNVCCVCGPPQRWRAMRINDQMHTPSARHRRNKLPCAPRHAAMSLMLCGCILHAVSVLHTATGRGRRQAPRPTLPNSLHCDYDHPPQHVPAFKHLSTASKLLLLFL